jgi:predicted ArsR family transcriptional regulator
MGWMTAKEIADIVGISEDEVKLQLKWLEKRGIVKSKVM